MDAPSPVDRPWVDFALVTALSLLWLAANGYTFGLDDHAIHLAFLLRAVKPHFLENDPLVQAATTHPSLFWILQAPLVRRVPIELLYLVLHFATLLGVFAGMRALTRALWPGPVGRSAARLALPLCLIAHVTLTRVPTVDATVLNRTVVLPLLLFALAAALRRRWLLAAVLCGVAFDLHPTSGAQTFALVAAALAVDREGRRRLAPAILAFTLAAAPLLALIAVHHAAAGVPSPAPADWIALTLQRSAWHHYASTWSAGQWLLVVPPLVLAGLAFSTADGLTHELRALAAFLGATALLCVTAYVALERLHLPFPLELHLWQSTRMLDFLGAAAGAGWLVRSAPFGERSIKRVLVAVAGVALLAAFAWGGLGAWMLPLAVLVVALGRRATATSPLRISVVHALAAAAALAVAQRAVRVPPLFQTRFDQLRGARVAAWSRAHLPETALVAVPPLADDALAAFRYGARRAMVGTFKDGGEASFNLAYARTWKRRMEALCRCRAFDELGVGPGITAALAERIRRGYDAADAPRLHDLAKTLGVTHAIFDVQRPRLALPVEYQDDEYRLYRLD